MSSLSVVISSSYGTPNIGDEAILTSLIKSLEESKLKPTINILSLTPQDTQKRHPSTKCIQSGVIRGLISTWSVIKQSDMLIVGGGGLIQDSSSFANIIFHLSRPLIAIITRTSFIGYGLGVGPIKSKIGCWLTGKIFQRAEFICVRDNASHDLLFSLGIPKQIIFIFPDLVYNLPLPDAINGITYTSKYSSKPQTIGFSIRPEAGKHKPSAIPSSHYQKIISELTNTINALADRENTEIIFISMHPEQDDKIAHRIKREIDHPDRMTIIPGHSTPNSVITAMHQLDILVGMRLHSLIFASRLGIPVIGLCYDQKIKELGKLLNLDDYFVGLNNISSESITQKIDLALENKRTLIKNTLRQTHKLQENSQKNTNMLLEFLGKLT